VNTSLCPSFVRHAALSVALAVALVSPARAEDPPLSDLPGREPVVPDLAPRVARGLDPTAEPSTLRLSFATRQSAERRDYAGSVVLTLPTDLFGPAAKAKEIDVPEGDDDPDFGDAASASPGSRRASLESERALPPLRPRDARAAVFAAERAVGFDGDVERADALASRARWSALLPKLRLRATRLVDESSSVSPTSYDPDRTTASGGASLWLEARTTWRLDRLLFASEEVRIERLRLSAAKRARRARREVLELLHRWRRALLEVSDPALDSQACRRAQLEAEHAAASLDVITDGWFSEWRGRSGRPSPDCDPTRDGTGQGRRSRYQRREVDLTVAVAGKRDHGPQPVRDHVGGKTSRELSPE
jgi:hypothetical protein